MQINGKCGTGVPINFEGPLMPQPFCILKNESFTGDATAPLTLPFKTPSHRAVQ